MKKTMMLLAVMLLVFVGCNDTEEPSLVEENQSMEDMNDDEVLVTKNETIGETSSENDSVYENDNVVIYDNGEAVDSFYFDSMYNDNFIKVEWNLTPLTTYGEAYINGDENLRIGGASKDDNDQTYIWYDETTVLIGCEQLIDIESPFERRNFFKEEVDDYVASAINKDLTQAAFMTLSEDFKTVNVYSYSVSDNEPVLIYEEDIDNLYYYDFYSMAFYNDTELIFSIPVNSSRVELISLNMITGEKAVIDEDYLIDRVIENSNYILLKSVGSSGFILYDKKNNISKLDVYAYDCIVSNDNQGLFYINKDDDKLYYYEFSSEHEIELLDLMSFHDHQEIASSIYLHDENIYIFDYSDTLEEEGPMYGHSYLMKVK